MVIELVSYGIAVVVVWLVAMQLRSAKARTQPALEAAIACALAAVTSADAMGWFASCGYSII